MRHGQTERGAYLLIRLFNYRETGETGFRRSNYSLVVKLERDTIASPTGHPRVTRVTFVTCRFPTALPIKGRKKKQKRERGGEGGGGKDREKKKGTSTRST